MSWLAWMALSGCIGAIDDGVTTEAPPPSRGMAPLPANIDAVASGVRRLSMRELRDTLVDLVGVDPADSLYGWPEETKPFDNNYISQVPSNVLAEKVAVVAENVAHQVAGDASLRMKVVGCAPAAADDTACLTQFITAFGRRALRRPLDDDEVAGLLKDATSTPGTFNKKIEKVLRIVLQDPEFLYRVECGGCTLPGATALAVAPDAPIKLGSWEMASRLSYLLWGSMPDDALFSAAARDALATPAGVREQALRMLATQRGRNQVSRFHAMWLGYEWSAVGGQLPYPADMLKETSALIERVIFEKRGSWLDLLTSRDTFVTDQLAAHYGDVDKPGSTKGKWVSYRQGRRAGILSHGSYLSVANGVADASTTLRGKYIRNQLLCEEIPQPDAKKLKELNNGKEVDITKPPDPAAGECQKSAIETTYLGNQGCAACHGRMDPIGFGLHNFDRTGKFRSIEATTRPRCTIDGKGKLDLDGQVQEFTGPGGLGKLLAEGAAGQRVGRCLTRKLFEFVVGRSSRQQGDDEILATLTDGFEKSAYDFQDLLVAYVSSPTFGVRRPHSLGEGK